MTETNTHTKLYGHIAIRPGKTEPCKNSECFGHADRGYNKRIDSFYFHCKECGWRWPIHCSIRYKFWARDSSGQLKQFSEDAGGSLKAACAIQAEFTKAKYDGSLDKRGPIDKLQKIVISSTSDVLIWTAIYFADYLAPARRRGEMDYKEVVNSPTYKRDKSFIREFFHVLGVTNMGELKIKHLAIYKAIMLENGLANSSVNRKIDTLKPMLKQAFMNGYTNSDLSGEFIKQKVSQRAVTIIDSLDLITRILTTCQKRCKDFTPLLCAYLKLGIRKGEGIDFKKDWVRRAERKTTIWGSKIQRFREIEMDEDIHALLVALKDAPANETEFLFTDKSGRPWTSRKIIKRLETIRKNINNGITPKMSDAQARSLIACNTFRHTYGSLVSKIWGISEASTFLGHSKIQTTKDYYVNVYINFAKRGAGKLPYDIRNILGNKIGNIKINTFRATMSPDEEKTEKDSPD